MAEDPALPLTDVQLVLGHAQLTTTQIYLTPRKEDVIRRVLAHHAEQTRQASARARPAPAPATGPGCWTCYWGTGRRDLRPPGPGCAGIAGSACPGGHARPVSGACGNRGWPATTANREETLGRLTCAPFVSDSAAFRKTAYSG